MQSFQDSQRQVGGIGEGEEEHMDYTYGPVEENEENVEEDVPMVARAKLQTATKKEAKALPALISRLEKEGRKATFKNMRAPNLPPCPQFEPLRHREVRAVRRWKGDGPPGFRGNWHPVDFFNLMWTDSELQLIVESTNAYAKAHGAGEPHHREWRDTTVGKMKVWLGLVVYMGVWGQWGGYERYWTQDPDEPQHPLFKTAGMPMRRWEQIKRFIHASPIVEDLPQERWFEKMEPLVTVTVPVPPDLSLGSRID